MNDSATNQNQTGFYQDSTNQPTSAQGSDNTSSTSAPMTSQVDQSTAGDSVQDYQPPVQSAQSPAQPSQADPIGVTTVSQPEVTETAETTVPVSEGENSPAAIPATEPAVKQVTEPQGESQQPQMQPTPAVANETTSADVQQQITPADGVPKTSPEEVVRKLAERIKAYQANQANQADQAVVGSNQPSSDNPTAPAGAVIVTPALPSVSDEPGVTDSVSELNTQVTPPISELDKNSASDATTKSTREDGSQPDAETLDTQNIFELLGVMDGSDQEKDAFLDQLQQVIWEDFLENDVQLLLTKTEITELHALLEEKDQSETDRQEAAVVYLEKLIPDLESIMLEKALDLKREMVFERIAGMRELHGGKAEVLAKITEAEVLFKQDKWLSGAQILNAIK
jgi:hypothetical protein